MPPFNENQLHNYTPRILLLVPVKVNVKLIKDISISLSIMLVKYTFVVVYVLTNSSLVIEE
jgi:hypothetical protein